MSFKARVIDFFTTTEKTGWGKNQIIYKLRELDKDYPKDEGPIQYSLAHLSSRVAANKREIAVLKSRLLSLENPEELDCSLPKISSTVADDDVPF